MVNSIYILGNSPLFVSAVRAKYAEADLKVFSWRECENYPVAEREAYISPPSAILICGYDYRSGYYSYQKFCERNIFAPCRWVNIVKGPNTVVVYIDTMKPNADITYSRYQFAKSHLGNLLQSDCSNFLRIAFPTIVNLNGWPEIHGSTFTKLIFFILIKIGFLKTINTNEMLAKIHFTLPLSMRAEATNIDGKYLGLRRSVFIDRLLRILFLAKILIIGGGIAAAISRLVLGEGADVITPKVPLVAVKEGIVRRKSVEIKKFFAKNVSSYGRLNIDIKFGRLHDLLALGGNSNVWGGFVDTQYFSRALIDLLRRGNIIIEPLSKAVTGSESSIKSISQLQNHLGEVLSAAYLLQNSIDGYLDSFHSTPKGIDLNLLARSPNENYQIFLDRASEDKLVLCVGVVQLIDLLFRSKLIKNGDKISFSEFKSKFKATLFSGPLSNQQDCVIQYRLGRALCHALGIQRYPKLLRVLDRVPIFINQVFLAKSSEFDLLIQNNTLVDAESSRIQSERFGGSVHYCDMRINGVGVGKFLRRYDPNIIGLGMPFVEQISPGPISNDIILDAFRKLIAIKPRNE